MSSLDLYRVAQVRRFDDQTLEREAISALALMQRAAAAAFAVLVRHWPGARRLVVLCGAGNNGGDGYLLALLAQEAGLTVDLFALQAPPVGSVAAQARAAFINGGGIDLAIAQEPALPSADVYVDALFGTGLSRAPAGIAAALISRLNATGVPVLAIDVPSGVDADSGAVPGAAVNATVTVSFIVHKRGLFTGAALDHCGALVLETLAPVCVAAGGIDGVAGTNQSEPPDARCIDLAQLAPWLAPRRKNTNKGSFGHVLAIGGDHGTGGAIHLTAESALRCGAGLVSVATRGSHITALNASRPELMARAIEDAQALVELLPRASTLALGPGLGQRAWGHALWSVALASGKPQVIDADALNLLALQPSVFAHPTVLTPHPGEAARLLGTTTALVQQDRFAAVRALAKKYHAVVVLKGAGSLVCDLDGTVAVCRWGNPGMAVAGMGDLLTGVIAALLAQAIPAWPAARLGVAIHALAGDAAALQGERGLIASDLLPHLRHLVNRLPA